MRARIGKRLSKGVSILHRMASEWVPPWVEAGENNGETSKLGWSRLMRFPRRTLIPDDAARCRAPDFLSDGLACKLLSAPPGMNSHHSSLGDFAAGGGIVGGAISKRGFRRGSKRQTKRGAERAGPRKRPAVGTLAHTRNLVMAALRVWELKHGIHD